MERSLTLILNNKENNRMPLHEAIFVNLETMEAKELDVFISKKFDSSDDIRRKYENKITPFLEQNKDFIEQVERKLERRFSGSIIITEIDDNLMLERKKVLYKKHMVLFREITKIKKFMVALEARDYLNECKAKNDSRQYRRLFSEFYSRELRFNCFRENNFKRIMGQWRNAIKESDYYYDYVRVTLKEYKERYKELELDSLDVIYSKYLTNIELKQQTRKQAEIQDEIEDLEYFKLEDRLSKDLLNHLSDYVEPKRYRTYADEEGYPGDLEDWGQDIIPEDEIDGFDRGRVKILSNSKLNFFDTES